jgi:hypothetical protein
MRKAALAAFCVLPLLSVATYADDDKGRQIEAARAWAHRSLGSTCNVTAGKTVAELGDARLYDIRFRYRGQGQDEPDQVFTLIQLPCVSGAYNISSVFLTTGSQEGEYRLLSFAEPKLDYDYKDEAFTQLVAPPKAVGYIARSDLSNAQFDPVTGILSADAKWRGLGDAWSHGEWRFEEGDFVLARFAIDPIYNLNLDASERSRRKDQQDVFQIYPPDLH